MNIKILKEEENYLEFEIDNLTIAELLRSRLVNKFVCGWKREHPSKPPIFIIKGKKPKEAIKKAIEDLREELKELKKLK
jgi:DNA-directed RNA polymerase subunit L